MEEKRSIRIGDLLVGSGLLTDEVMSSRVDVAKLLSQPLGQTLVQFGDVTSYQLICAVQLQSLVLDGALELKSAIEALRIVRTSECYLEVALEKVGFIENETGTAKLGELLLDSGLIKPNQLQKALDVAFRDCTPLGQVLFQNGFVSPGVIVKSLAIQRRIRSGELTRAKAIDELKALVEAGLPALEP